MSDNVTDFLAEILAKNDAKKIKNGKMPPVDIDKIQQVASNPLNEYAENPYNYKKLIEATDFFNKKAEDKALKESNYKARFMTPFAFDYMKDINSQNKNIENLNTEIENKNKGIKFSNVLSDLGQTAEAILSSNPYRSKNVQGNIANIVPKQKEMKKINPVNPDFIGLGKSMYSEPKDAKLINPLDVAKQIDTVRLNREEMNNKVKLNQDKLDKTKLQQTQNVLPKISKDLWKMASSKDVSNSLNNINKDIKTKIDLDKALTSDNYTSAINIMYTRAKELNAGGRLTDQDFITAGLSQSWVDKFREFWSKGAMGSLPQNYKEYALGLKQMVDKKMNDNYQKAKNTVKQIGNVYNVDLYDEQINSLLDPFVSLDTSSEDMKTEETAKTAKTPIGNIKILKKERIQ